MDASDRSTWEAAQVNGWGRWPHESVVRMVKRHATSGRALEIGCGIGAQLRFLAEAGFDAVGVDFSRVALAQVMVDVPVLQADARTLPFPADSFDLVVEVEVAYCLPDPAPILDEVRRVLKPGGLFVSVCFTDACTEDVGAATGGTRSHDMAASWLLVDEEVVRRVRGASVVEERVITARA